MAIIYSYPQFAPKPEDLLIGTVTLDENAAVPIYDNPTVSFTIQSLLDMIAPITGAQNLQQVTNIGATTSNTVTFTSDIKVTGRFYDSAGSPGAAGQVLSSTVTGTSWIVNAPASVTSVGLAMPAAFSVANSPVTTAGVLTVTGAGTAAQYINGLGALVTFPTIPTQYVLPLAASGTRGGIQIGYTSAGKNYAVQLSSEKAFVNVPWTDTPYTLPAATNAALGGIKIGYTDNAKNYAVELDADSEAFVNVPWTDTGVVTSLTTTGTSGVSTLSGTGVLNIPNYTYTLPLAADGTRGGVQIGYTQASTRDYPVTLASEKMFVTVPWTDTPYVLPVATASDLGGVKIGYTQTATRDYPVTLDSDKMLVTIPWINTWVANAVTVAGYVAAPAATDANLVWKTDANGNPAWRADGDTGITGVTATTADSTGAPLSESITNRELTLTSHKYVGGTNVGYVPEGGTGDLYLKGDGTWAAVPTGLQFKGTWDASGGGGGSPDLTLAANQGDGFLWITSVAGTAYPNGGSAAPSTWNVGDWAVYVGAAGSGTWTRVPVTSSGVTTVNTTDGTYIDLTPNAATTGAVTVTADLSAANGTSDTNTRFLSKDNTWDVPSYTTDNNTTYTVDVPSATTSINLAGSDGTNDAIALAGGTNVTLSRTDANTIGIASTDTNTQNEYATSWVQSTNDILLRLTESGAGSGTQDIKIVKGANIDFTYTDVNNFTITATDTQENTTWYVRDSADADKTVNNSKYLKFVTATGTLGTALTGAGTTGDPYLMTLTSPDTNTQNTYTAGAGLSLSSFEFSADINTTAASSGTNNLSTDSGKYYAVQLDNNSTAADRKMVVNVPWSSGGTYNWKVKDNTGTPIVKTLASTETLQFVMASHNAAPTATLTDTSGASPYIMTLTGRDTTYSNFTAASAASAGASGLVVAPPAGAQGKFLRGDATWVSVPQGDITEIKTTAPITGAATSGIATIAISTMGAATAAAAGAKGAVPASVAGDQLKFLRADATWVVPTDTNTWNANTKTVAGYVAAPGAVASKVWKTDTLGNPAWRDDDTGSNTTYSIDVPSATTNINLKGANPSSNDAIALTSGTYVSVTRNSDSQLTFDLSAVNGTDTFGTRFLSKDNTWDVPTVTNIEVIVTVVSTGSGNKYYLNGVQQADYILMAGFTYQFNQSDSTNSSHPLLFSITSDGKWNSGVEYTTGVTKSGTPGSAGAYTQIIVTKTTPNLYYYCFNHSGMGGSTPRNASFISLTTAGTGASSLSNGILNVPNTTYTLPLAADGTRGGVQIGYTETGKNYPVELSSEKMFVNVPWTDGDTTYSNGTGLDLSAGNQFSINSTVVTLTGTQTLTNKTLTTPIIDRISPSAGLLQVDGYSTTDGGIKLMCYAGTHGQILKSQPHSASVTNTMLLPAGANSTLVSEATETVQSLTTTGTSGAATLSGSGVLNIPQYSLTESDTLATVTGRGASTGTACSFTNQTSFTVGSSGTGSVYIGNTATSKFARFHTNNTDTYYDMNCGNVLWRQSSNTRFKFDMTSAVLTCAGDIVAFGTPSDKRLKENIKPIESALEKAMKLQGVTFDWKKSNSELNIKEDIGFIAQDIQKVVPELVRENENGMLSMRHQGIAPILLEAIKELKAEIEELKLKSCNCNK